MGDQRNPHDIVDRIRLASEGGVRVFGFGAADLRRTRDDKGLHAIRTMLDDNWINRVEVMRAARYREHWGVEIIGGAYRHQPIEESIPYAFLTSRRQFDFLE